MKPKKPNVKPIVDQVRAAVRASGLSHYRVANLTGVSTTTVSKFMSSDRDPSVGLLQRIADALHVRLAADATDMVRQDDVVDLRRS